jgi:hypothetical protein
VLYHRWRDCKQNLSVKDPRSQTWVPLPMHALPRISSCARQEMGYPGVEYLRYLVLHIDRLPIQTAGLLDPDEAMCLRTVTYYNSGCLACSCVRSISWRRNYDVLCWGVHGHRSELSWLYRCCIFVHCTVLFYTANSDHPTLYSSEFLGDGFMQPLFWRITCSNNDCDLETFAPVKEISKHCLEQWRRVETLRPSIHRCGHGQNENLPHDMLMTDLEFWSSSCLARA